MTKTLKRNIWAVAGGKGGVGKSLLSTNFAIDLAEQNKKVVLIDADFGGSNIHTFFGLSSSRISISDFLTNDHLGLDDVLMPTGVANLKVASGAHDVMGISSPKQSHSNKLIRAIQSLPVDYVVIDLGAGTSNHTLDLFLSADKGILVTAPEPTSVENTYRFVKSAFYRKLKTVIDHPEIRSLLEQITESKHQTNPKTPTELVARIMKINVPAGEALKYELANFKLKLVINQVRTPSDARIGFTMKRAFLKYFGISVEYTGFVEHDPIALESVRQRVPVLHFDPNANASKCIRKVAHNIRKNYHLMQTNQP